MWTTINRDLIFNSGTSMFYLAQIKCIKEHFRESYILESSLGTNFLRIQSRKYDKKQKSYFIYFC
jgi:hypothetical protein